LSEQSRFASVQTLFPWAADAIIASPIEPPAIDHPNSLAAAASVKPVAPGVRQRVFEFILKRGKRGATREEIERSTKIKHQTINPRIAELRKAGLIRESGKSRPTRSGRSAAVWIAVGVE
jgi:hypothetical protein